MQRAPWEALRKRRRRPGMIRRSTIYGFLLGLALAIPPSSVEPEPSCERQAVEAIRPAVERALREWGTSDANDGYYRGYNSESARESRIRSQVAVLYSDMKGFERECLRRKLNP